MKNFKIEDFINPEKINLGTKRQLFLRNSRKKRDRERNSTEELFLLRAMLNDIRRMEKEGVIKKHGRFWKFNI